MGDQMIASGDGIDRESESGEMTIAEGIRGEAMTVRDRIGEM